MLLFYLLFCSYLGYYYCFDSVSRMINEVNLSLAIASDVEVLKFLCASLSLS